VRASSKGGHGGAARWCRVQLRLRACAGEGCRGGVTFSYRRLLGPSWRGERAEGFGRRAGRQAGDLRAYVDWGPGFGSELEGDGGQEIWGGRAGGIWEGEGAGAI